MELVDSILLNIVPLLATVTVVAQSIASGRMTPYGDYGTDHVYYFDPAPGLGAIRWTVFDRETTLALASYTARYGAATIIQSIIFGQHPRTQIDLLHPILPKVPVAKSIPLGRVVPE